MVVSDRDSWYCLEQNSQPNGAQIDLLWMSMLV